MSKIFSNLKFLRLQKGLSQEQMAESLGITRSRLGAYEENRNEPSIDLLITISDFFHIAAVSIWAGETLPVAPALVVSSRVGTASFQSCHD
jgi:transcriptional regulator with XRE-family HTH domain